MLIFLMNRIKVIVMLMVGAISISAVQFDPTDESDYVDNADEPLLQEPAHPSDFTLQTGPTTAKDVQGEIEKLLRQPVIHYVDPASTKSTPSPTIGVDIAETVSNMEVYVAPISRNKGLSEHGELSSTSSKTPGLNLRTWNNQKTTRSKRQRTKEVVYSVYATTGGQNLVRKKRPGVIESLVGAHDIVRHESTRRRVDAGAYNEGGIRKHLATGVYEDQNSTARRYLVQPPAHLVTSATRPPRPTPTTMYLETTYRYTRRTRRHPNCTDDYYECLALCFDRKGYRVRCKHETTVRPPPHRINMSGLVAAALEIPLWDYDTDKQVREFKSWLLDRGYRTCVSYTTTTTTLPKLYPIYYDDVLSKNTGRIMAKCWVCGLLDYGIPRNANCAENFGSITRNTQLTEKNSYRRYCRYMDEVPLWFNRTDPFSIWGQWTGGCSYRFLDLSGLYTQRTCRSTTYPAVGNHYLSRRMATLELSLKGEKDGCIVSPMASLVPFSRAVSLYARFHVCVCSGSFCNRATRGQEVAPATILIPLLLLALRELHSRLS